MDKCIKTNREDLPILDAETMNAIFDCVYGVDDHLNTKTQQLLENDFFRSFANLLETIQQFNYQFRQPQLGDLFPIFERTVGPMETNSDGTVLYLALGLAIKETYQMKNQTLENLLLLVKVRK